MNTPISITVRNQDRAAFGPGAVLTQHVARGTTPAASAVVTDSVSEVASWAAGTHTYDSEARVAQLDDLFDLASVTKVVATATMCGILVDRGKLDLDEPVRELIPESSADRRITSRSLLSHCSGLPAHVHLYKHLIDRSEIVEAVMEMPLEYEPLTQALYSDLGYILLGELLERIGGVPLNELFRDLVRDPMGLHETVFCPGQSNRDRIVPTEDDLSWRGRLVHGEVHDENASVMGGVAPHAGLFSTVLDMGKFVRLWLNGGVANDCRLISTETARAFRSRAGFVEDSTWALGWDTVSPSGSASGRFFSPESYGILGFTGTSIWMDPEKELGVVLLTNRVHPTRDNWKIRELRPAFHDAVMEM